jgi:restriction system protein
MGAAHQSRFLSLLALAGLAALAVRLGALRQWGLPTILLGGVALVSAVLLLGSVRAIRQWSADRHRAMDLAVIDEMDGLEFERWVQELLERRGFRAALTPPSDDRGVDIVAERDDLRCAVQVKRHRGLVSRHAVSDVVGGMKQYSCEAAMVITNSYFTEAAAALAEANDCALVDRDMLAEWMSEAPGQEG